SNDLFSISTSAVLAASVCSMTSVAPGSDARDSASSMAFPNWGSNFRYRSSQYVSPVDADMRADIVRTSSRWTIIPSRSSIRRWRSFRSWICLLDVTAFQDKHPSARAVTISATNNAFIGPDDTRCWFSAFIYYTPRRLDLD